MTEKSWDESLVADNLRRIEEKMEAACVKAGRKREEITLLAVTKTVPPALINAAIRGGVRQIGENRVQELLRKEPELELAGAAVHLIGHLQTNKVRQVAGHVHMVQSVDSLRLARTLNDAYAARGETLAVLVEVNVGREESKSGALEEELPALLEGLQALKHLRVRGLMCIPPISDEETGKRKYFSQIYKLFIDIKAKKLDNISMDVLSMGMSSDFEEAILEGSTMVRIGSALFGKRV